MAIFQIPTFTDPANYQMTIDLDGTIFGLIFIYNPRDAHWRVDIEDESGVRIRSGLKLVTGWPVLNNWRAQNRPHGELIMIDPGGEDREADLNAIGQTIFLTYIEEASLV